MKKFLAFIFIAVCSCAILFAAGQAEKAVKADDGKETLVVWDQFYPASQNQLMDEFVKEFEEMHNCKIERVLYDTESMRTTLRTALSSNIGPDIFYYDAGPAFLGAFVNAGLVYDLSDTYVKKGWNNTLAGWTIERVMYNGKQWAVPHEIEFTCLYYNKDIVSKLGFNNRIIKIPGKKDLWTFRSFQDYLDLVQAAKDAGYIGISLGMRNPGYGGHLFSYLVTLSAGKEKIDNILFGDGTWADADVIRALSYFEEFSKKGFYTPSPNSVSYDETNALFFGGRTATNPAGTWLVSDILDEVDDPSKIGFLLLPSMDNPSVISAGAGIGSAFAISEASSKKELAVEFLDYITNKQNSERWISQGQVIPANVKIDLDLIDLPEMMEQAIEGAELVHAYNLDVIMPSEWNQAMMNGIQALVNGTDTPRGVAQKMQEAWAGAKLRGDIWKAY